MKKMVPPTLEELIGDLKSPDKSVANQALKKIISMKAAAIPQMFAMFDAPIKNKWDIQANRKLRVAFKSIGDQALPFLVKALSQKDEKTQSRAVDALFYVGLPAIPILLKCMSSKNKTIRDRTLLLLRNLEKSVIPTALVFLLDVRSFPILNKLLKNKEERMRLAAIRALGSIKSNKGFSSLMKVLNNRKEGLYTTRLSAARSLGWLARKHLTLSQIRDAGIGVAKLKALVRKKGGPKWKELAPIFNYIEMLINDAKITVGVKSVPAKKRI